jgi:hypothetical protein
LDMPPPRQLYSPLFGIGDMIARLPVILDGPDRFHGVAQEILLAVVVCFLVALAIFVGTRISREKGKNGKKGTLPPIFWYFFASGVGLIALFMLLGFT